MIYLTIFSKTQMSGWLPQGTSKILKNSIARLWMESHFTGLVYVFGCMTLHGSITTDNTISLPSFLVCHEIGIQFDEIIRASDEMTQSINKNSPIVDWRFPKPSNQQASNDVQSDISGASNCATGAPNNFGVTKHDLE